MPERLQLLPDDQLAVRQARISAGLLREGMRLEKIRALPWYDERLERLVTRANVDRFHTPNHPHIDLSALIVDGSSVADTPADADVFADSDADIADGESKEDRRKRQNREAQARSRAARKLADGTDA